MKIDTIDLTHQFSLSIFTDFRYQSIKITRVLSIFIDTDFIDWQLRDKFIVIFEAWGPGMNSVNCRSKAPRPPPRFPTHSV